MSLNYQNQTRTFQLALELTCPSSSSCKGGVCTLVALHHDPCVISNWEWPTQPRVDGETELRQGLEPYGSVRVPGSGLLSQPGGIFPMSPWENSWLGWRDECPCFPAFLGESLASNVGTLGSFLSPGTGAWSQAYHEAYLLSIWATFWSGPSWAQ